MHIPAVQRMRVGDDDTFLVITFGQLPLDF
jgi:hypothetical protein